MTDKLAVNITVVCWNRLEATKRLLNSIEKFPSGYPFELTLINNGSTDGTLDFFKSDLPDFVTRIIHIPENVGIAKAYNLGWRLGCKEYYMKLDNDMTFLKVGWLKHLIEMVKGIPKVGAVAYNVEPNNYPVKKFGGITAQVKQGNLGGCTMLLPKDTWDKLGYWYEGFGLYGGVDGEYGNRILYAGLLNCYSTDKSMVRHFSTAEENECLIMAEKVCIQYGLVRKGAFEKRKKEYVTRLKVSSGGNCEHQILRSRV